MDKIFVSEFFKHPIQISTAFPVQPSLAEKMARVVGGKKIIAEFGSGTGAITKYLIKRLPEEGQLFCMEINPEFCRELGKIQDQRVQIINDCAQKLYDYAEKGSIEGIVCSVPLSLMGREKREELIKTAAESPLFVPMQCWLPTLTGTLESYFRSVNCKFVPNHIPPSWYYICRNNRG